MKISILCSVRFFGCSDSIIKNVKTIVSSALDSLHKRNIKAVDGKKLRIKFISSMKVLLSVKYKITLD